VSALNLEELGQAIRRSRLARGLTQAQLAQNAGLTRVTLNQLENGLIRDLGVRKLTGLLTQLDLTLNVDAVPDRRQSDYLRLASTAASVSFKTPLTEQELQRALLTGKIPTTRRAHIRTLLEEAPSTLLEGLIAQVGRFAKPGKVERNVARIAAALDISRRVTGD
jgi:transcriptional regulator with XRE-family HTH domain